MIMQKMYYKMRKVSEQIASFAHAACPTLL